MSHCECLKDLIKLITNSLLWGGVRLTVKWRGGVIRRHSSRPWQRRRLSLLRFEICKHQIDYCKRSSLYLSHFCTENKYINHETIKQ
jgi:hypothetical protein